MWEFWLHFQKEVVQLNPLKVSFMLNNLFQTFVNTTHSMTCQPDKAWFIEHKLPWPAEISPLGHWLIEGEKEQKPVTVNSRSRMDGKILPSYSHSSQPGIPSVMDLLTGPCSLVNYAVCEYSPDTHPPLCLLPCPPQLNQSQMTYVYGASTPLIVAQNIEYVEKLINIKWRWMRFMVGWCPVNWEGRTCTALVQRGIQI